MGFNKRLLKDSGAALDATTYFKPQLYTGNNTNGHAITGVGFSAELIWIKRRTPTDENHSINDRIRGIRNSLASNSSGVAATQTTLLTAFGSDGFTLGKHPYVNSVDDFVAWCFNGGGPAVTNTTGDISSFTSANPDYGFSIIKYTGNGGSGQSVGTGLSSAPDLVIFKRLDAVANWYVFANIGGTYKRFEGLNTTNAAGSVSFFTAQSNTITWSGSTTDFNGSSRDYIMYAFHSVDEIQKIGSYTGTGTSFDVSVGFEPRFVMVKRIGASGSWMVYDSARGATSSSSKSLAWNTTSSEAERTGTNDEIIFTSDGFTVPDDTGNGLNSTTTGNTYLYLAIA